MSPDSTVASGTVSFSNTRAKPPCSVRCELVLTSSRGYLSQSGTAGIDNKIRPVTITDEQ